MQIDPSTVDIPTLAIFVSNLRYKLVPLDGGKRTKLSLICQTNLQNMIPLALANMKIVRDNTVSISPAPLHRGDTLFFFGMVSNHY